MAAFGRRRRTELSHPNRAKNWSISPSVACHLSPLASAIAIRPSNAIGFGDTRNTAQFNATMTVREKRGFWKCHQISQINEGQVLGLRQVRPNG